MPPAPSNLLGHPDMAPPSYAAAVGSKKVNYHDDDGELYGDASYVPVYTFAQPYTVRFLHIHRQVLYCFKQLFAFVVSKLANKLFISCTKCV